MPLIGVDDAYVKIPLSVVDEDIRSIISRGQSKERIYSNTVPKLINHLQAQQDRA